ncbi:MAG: ammonium transporter [Nitrospirae bacterium]|nr:ammonium transporter [Nitrospirota bacterium]
MNRLKKFLSPGSLIPFAGTLLWAGWAIAQEVMPEMAAPVAEAAPPGPPPLDAPKVMADTLWTLITAMLVFWMNAGFALVESGLCRAKNAVNILSKNVIVFAMTSLAFLVAGFGIMFGDGNSLFGTHGLWFLGGADNSPYTGDAYQGDYKSIAWTGTPLWAKFFFQLVFAGTAATIVSGAVAERIKYASFIIFTVIMGIFLYPVTGHWIWGGGWLAQKGMWDFAGSTVVHSVGGWAALVGAILLGPRIGKYTKEGKVNPIPGHNLGFATLGVMILWLGWFGFNPGSTMAADWNAISGIAVTTNTAAAAAGFAATIASWILFKKPDLSMTLNGILAGLVAITAPCAFVSVKASVAIGLVAGVLVVLSVLFFDRVKVDDPVGALSVHLVNGIWGTLSLGLFGSDAFVAGPGMGLFYGGGFTLLGAQFLGVVTVGLYTVIVALIAWGVVRVLTGGLRVSAEEEQEGLDLGEHGQACYPDFATHQMSGIGLEEDEPKSERRAAGAPVARPVHQT